MRSFSAQGGNFVGHDPAPDELVGVPQPFCTTSYPRNIGEAINRAAWAYARLWQDRPGARPTWLLWLETCFPDWRPVRFCSMSFQRANQVHDLCLAAYEARR